MSIKIHTGFTLIEILIVLAAIIILASIIMANFERTGAQARDTQRLSDIKAMQTALASYRSEHGLYPCGDGNTSSPDHTNGTSDSSSSDGFLNGACNANNTPFSVPNCLNTPQCGLYADGIFQYWIKDPLNIDDMNEYWYIVDGNRREYVLFTILENNSELMQNDGGACDNYYETGDGLGARPTTGDGPSCISS